MWLWGEQRRGQTLHNTTVRAALSGNLLPVWRWFSCLWWCIRHICTWTSHSHYRSSAGGFPEWRRKRREKRWDWQDVSICKKYFISHRFIWPHCSDVWSWADHLGKLQRWLCSFYRENIQEWPHSGTVNSDGCWNGPDWLTLSASVLHIHTCTATQPAVGGRLPFWACSSKLWTWNCYEEALKSFTKVEILSSGSRARSTSVSQKLISVCIRSLCFLTQRRFSQRAEGQGSG